MSRSTVLLVLALAATGCSNGSDPAADAATSPQVATPNASVAAIPQEAPMPDAAERAKAAAGDFSGRLRAALMERMGSEGPVGAVDFCHTQAPLIGDAVMDEHGVRMGRVAVPGRNRNPGNVPTDWQRQALAGFQSAVDSGAAPAEQVFVQRDGLPPGVALRMMRGIAVEPGCLACHGSSLAPAVAEAIQRNYPDDAATGFQVGDLRGGLWVEVPDVGS